MKYPDECPVFRVDGIDFEARPYFYVWAGRERADYEERNLVLIDEYGLDAGWLVPMRAVALTGAARRLVRWMCS